jgi:hypothetical protein
VILCGGLSINPEVFCAKISIEVQVIMGLVIEQSQLRLLSKFGIFVTAQHFSLVVKAYCVNWDVGLKDGFNLYFVSCNRDFWKFFFAVALPGLSCNRRLQEKQYNFLSFNYIII